MVAWYVTVEYGGYFWYLECFVSLTSEGALVLRIFMYMYISPGDNFYSLFSSWWMLGMMSCYCTMSKHCHNLYSWWNLVAWRLTRQEISPITSVWYTCWLCALRERTCLLRSNVTRLYHWMIYCILSLTKIVSRRSVHPSVCLSVCLNVYSTLCSNVYHVWASCELTCVCVRLAG